MVNYWTFVLRLSAGLPGHTLAGEICSPYLFDLGMAMQFDAFLVNERTLSLCLSHADYIFLLFLCNDFYLRCSLFDYFVHTSFVDFLGLFHMYSITTDNRYTQP